MFKNKKLLFGNNQKENGNKNIPKKILIQFKEKFKIFVEGSNIENKFIIIFNGIFFL